MPNSQFASVLNPEVAAAGFPADYTDGFLQALTAAGLTVVDDQSQSVTTLDGVTVERRAMTGVPGGFLVGASLGTRGWVVWTEFQVAGKVERSALVFVSGNGSLVGT